MFTGLSPTRCRGGRTGGRHVDPTLTAVDDRCIVPTHIAHGHVPLWEPGDNTGKAIGTLTWADTKSSTIHSPYYYLWFDTSHTHGRERERRREVPMRARRPRGSPRHSRAGDRQARWRAAGPGGQPPRRGPEPHLPHGARARGGGRHPRCRRARRRAAPGGARRLE